MCIRDRGLFGKWGTGKTSIINMAINEINSLADCDKKEKSNENKPLIIKFSPWNYSDKDNLITCLLYTSTYLANNPNTPKPPTSLGSLPVLGNFGFGGMYLFVRSYPFIDFSYPGTSTSSMLYSITLPFS